MPRPGRQRVADPDGVEAQARRALRQGQQRTGLGPALHDLLARRQQVTEVQAAPYRHGPACPGHLSRQVLAGVARTNRAMTVDSITAQLPPDRDPAVEDRQDLVFRLRRQAENDAVDADFLAEAQFRQVVRHAEDRDRQAAGSRPASTAISRNFLITTPTPSCSSRSARGIQPLP